MKYLDYYYKWAKRGTIENISKGMRGNGLCNSPIAGTYCQDPLFWLFKPTYSEQVRLAGDNAFWASDMMLTGDEEKLPRGIATKFTSTRQNIVLFMAAMNGEL